ncbi:MAG: hypothetical protein Q9220_000565 [cf. Caloplaca sp. 1 TL-2023]
MELSCSFGEKAELKLELYPIPSLKTETKSSEEYSIQHTSSNIGLTREPDPSRTRSKTNKAQGKTIIPKIVLRQETRKSTPTLLLDGVEETLHSHDSRSETARSKQTGQNETEDQPSKSIAVEELEKTDQEDSKVPASSISIDDLTRKCDVDLNAKDITCLAATSKGPRCKYRIAESNLKEARALLDSWKNRIIAERLEPRLDQFEQLASLLLCRRYHQKEASSFAKAWEAVRDSSTRLDQEIRPLEPPRTGRRVRSSPARTTRKDFFDSSQVYIRTFEPFDARAKSRICTQDFVQGAMKKNLNISEAQRHGLIYIYWFPGNFGHIKIGVTTKTPEERLEAWRKQCGHEPQLIYPTKEKDRELIPHVFRVEKLVQAQLRNCRRKQTMCRFGRGSRDLGIPTANIPLAGLSVGGHEDVESGVYFGWAGVDVDAEGLRGDKKGMGKKKEGGTEVHIMHTFAQDFYGARMNLLILGFIRPEYDYVDRDSLIEDIRTDIEVAGRSLERKAYADLKNDAYLLQFEGGEHEQEVAN